MRNLLVVCWQFLFMVGSCMASTSITGTTFIFSGNLSEQDRLLSGEYEIEINLFDNNNGRIENLTEDSKIVLDKGNFKIELDFKKNTYPSESQYFQITMNQEQATPLRFPDIKIINAYNKINSCSCGQIKMIGILTDAEDNSYVRVDNRLPITFINADICTISITSMGCGFLFLLHMYLWMKKGVNDPTLKWLCLGLFSWSIRCIFDLSNPDSEKTFMFILSPLSNIFFVVAAFNFSRIKENHRFQKGFLTTLIIVFVAGMLTFIFMLQDDNISYIGKQIDVFISILVLCLLGYSMKYSFDIYRFRYYSFVTIFVIIGYSIVQALNLYSDLHSPLFLYYFYILIKLFFLTALVILFVAQPTVWGLSVYSSLNTAKDPEEKTVVAIICDLRDSTNWVNSLNGEYNRLHVFLKRFKEHVLSSLSSIKVDRTIHEPSMIKYLGDGYLFVWEFKNLGIQYMHAVAEFSRCAVMMCQEYNKKIVNSIEFSGGVPEAMGIGVITGSAAALTLENGNRDYIGDSINKVSKLQNLARPNGGVVISNRVLIILKRLASEDKHNNKYKEIAAFFPNIHSFSIIPNENAEEIGATAEVNITEPMIQRDNSHLYV
jgi:class 3 adenylate cyclase